MADEIANEHTVSARTEELAKRNGVILQKLISGGGGLPNYVAIEVFSGRIVRTGNMGWIKKELLALGVPIHAVYSLPNE